jgi:hypothetical protein
VKNEVPQEDHDDRDQAKQFKDMKEKKIAPLDALFPKIRVSSDDEKQQTHHRMPAMDESPYREPCQERDDDGSTSPTRSPEPDHKASPDYNAGSKSKTRTRRR